jgi:hypothetical protein
MVFCVGSSLVITLKPWSAVVHGFLCWFKLGHHFEALVSCGLLFFELVQAWSSL